MDVLTWKQAAADYEKKSAGSNTAGTTPPTSGMLSWKQAADEYDRYDEDGYKALGQQRMAQMQERYQAQKDRVSGMERLHADDTVNDWLNRYNRVIQGITRSEQKRNGGFTQDADSVYGAEIDALLSGYDGIKNHSEIRQYYDSLTDLKNSLSAINESFSQFEDEEEFSRYMDFLKNQDEMRTASFKDLTLNSLKRGYYNSLYGEESFKDMNNEQNQKDAYEKILAGEDYQFIPGNDFAGAVSGAMELIGQQARQFTHPRTVAAVGAAGIGAFALGQAGPQVLAPEEVITVPGAMAAAFTAGSAASNLEIEAGHAYNEMLEKGISEETARKVAWGVGGVNAGLELLQVDELLDAYKVTKASGATKTVAQKIFDELLERGVDVAKETAQEVVQEGVTITGVQAASKKETGEYAYGFDEVKSRLKDTAKSSALTFGLMNVPAAAKNTASIAAEHRNKTDFTTPNNATLAPSNATQLANNATAVGEKSTPGGVTEQPAAVDDKLSATEAVAKNATTTVGVSKMETVQVKPDMDSFAQQFGTQAEAVKRNYLEGQDLQEYEVGFQTAYAMGLEGGKQEALGSVPYLSQSQREIAFSLGRDAAAAQKAAAPKKAAVTAKMTTEEGTQDVTIAEVVDMDDTTMTFRLEDGRTVTDNDLDFEKGQELMAAAWELGMDVKSVNTIVTESAANAAADADQAAGIQQAHHYGQHGYTMEQLTKYGADAATLTDGQRKAAWEAGRQIYLQKSSAPAPVLQPTKASGVWFDAGGGNVRSFDAADLSGLSETAVAGARAAQVLQKLGIGRNYYFFESYKNKAGERVYRDENGVEKKAPNGWYDPDGSIHIDLNAGANGNGLTLYTLSHELTHFVEKQDKQAYRRLAEFLVASYAKHTSVDELVTRKQAELSESRGVEVSYEDAYSEFIADSMEAMLSDGNVLEKLQELKKTDKSLFDKIREFFDNLARKIREIYKDLTPDSLEGKTVLQMKDQIDQIQQLFAEALVEAGENFDDAMEQVIQTNAEPVPAEEIVTDGAVVTDGGGRRYSIRSMKSDIAEGKMFEDLQTYCNWSKAQVDQLKKDLSELVDYMTPFRDVLDLNETYDREGRRFSAYKPNSDPLYQISMDFSTLCSKRLLTQFVIENLQLRENRPMTAEEQMAIRDMLIEYRKQEKGLQVACAMCYVEAARLKSPKQMQRWMNDPETYMRNYFADKDPDFAAYIKSKQEEFKESRGYKRNTPKKDMKPKDRTALNNIRQKVRAEYKPTASEQAIIDKAKSLPNSTYLTAANLANLSESDPAIYAAYTAFIRNATRSKSLETDEPYYYGDSRRDNGNGIIVSDRFIEAVNRENGMRFSSWSDWRIQHMLDYITAVIDNAVRGAAMHGYTKFPEEVRVLGKTGMMFNLSGVAGTQTGLNEDGSLSFSPTESIDKDEAVKLREDFPETAGLQCIGVGDDHIRELMKSDIIDYIIPYHVSGLNKALRTMADIQGWKDYTGTQHASIDHSVKLQDAADPEHWHEEPVFSEFFVGYDTGMTGIEAMQASAEQYRQMCHDRGLIPKFNQFYEKGNNYWKLLIDRKMINQKTGKLIRQKPVTPTFDFNEIKAVVKRHVDNYDSNMEARALNHIVENWDSIPGRIKDLKKGKKKTAPSLKAVNEVANQMLAAQGQEKYGNRMYSDRKTKHQKITMSMTDSERTEILKDKVITAEVYDGQADKTIAAEKENLKSHRDNLVKSALVKIGEEFGVFTDYSITDVDVDIRLSRGNLKESISKKIDPIQIAKLLPVFKTAVENAIGIECHANRYFYDNNTVMFENLIGGYVDGGFFVPVRFGLRHSVNGKATLYLIVDQEKISTKKIKAEVAKATEMQNANAYTSRSAFNISLASIMPFVNSKDILRYFPDDMLTNAQKKAKWEAVAETIIYTNNKNDSHYAEFIRTGNIVAAKRMVQQAAKVAGYTIKLHHGTAGEPFYVFRLGAEGIHFGTLAQATQRVDATRERLQYEHRTYTTEEIRRNLSSIPQAARQRIVEDAVSGRNSLSDSEVITGYDLADGSKIITDEDLLYYLDKSEREKYSLPNGIMGINIDGRVVDAYVKAEHPVVFDVDIGEWTAYNIADILIHKVKGQKAEVYSLNDHNWVDYDPAGISGIELTEADIPELERLSQEREFSAIAEFLQSKGVDSVRYLNTYEGSKNEESYILLSPEQVKLADAITYDVNGNIIPISKRFNPETKDIRYQDRATGTSNRDLLAGAFEDLARSPAEMEFLQKYQENIGLLNEQEQKLQEIRTEIRELTFGKGPKDPKRLAQLQEEARKTANRIDIYDKKLLRLEATVPLQRVLQRESSKAYKQGKEKSKQIYERRKDRREQAFMRQEIRKIIKRLDTLLKSETKEKHVPDSMKKAVAEALSLINDIELGTAERRMDALSTEVQSLKQKLSQAMGLGDRELVEEFQAQLDEKLIAMQRYEKSGGRLLALRDAYADIRNSTDPDIAAGYDAEVAGALAELSESLKDTSFRDMSKEQLQDVLDMYTMVLTRIRDANKQFGARRGETLQENAAETEADIRKFGISEKDPGIVVDKLGKLVRGFSWNNLRPVDAFHRLGSRKLEQLYMDLVDGMAQRGRQIKEIGQFITDIRKKTGYKSFDLKEAETYTTVDGKEMKLTLAEKMSIYAYSKRDQAYDHMAEGGFTYAKDLTYKEKGKTKVHTGKAKTWRLSMEDLQTICGSLTENQRQYVDAVQQFLTEFGTHGDKVNMELYGIKLFNKEHAYFPLQSDRDYRKSVENQLGGTMTAASLKSDGMTKKTVPGANNPIVLEDFDRVVFRHLDKMANYANLVLPLENLRRVFDYQTSASENQAPASMKALIGATFGREAQQYVEQFLTDANGTRMSMGVQNPLEIMFTRSKGMAVAANLSVMIQQISAVVRAVAEISPKHLMWAAENQKGIKLYDEMVRYAPIAIIKDMGGFDTGSSRSLEDYIGFEEAPNSAKKVWNNMQKLFGMGAETMDKVGWCLIWNGVKREVASRQQYEVNSEKFLQECGKRFTEVIVKTQVYDSVLSRSGYMRDKHGTMRYLTSFMGEPTVQAGMVFNSHLDVVRAIQQKKDVRLNVKKLIRTDAALISALVVNGMLKAIPYAMRDDDEDEGYWERWAKQFGSALSELWKPWELLPILRNIDDLASGRTIEQPDMALLSDLLQVGTKVIHVMQDEEAMADMKPDDWYALAKELAGSVGNLLGVPVKNIWRDAEGYVRIWKDATDGIDSDGMLLDAMWRGLKGEEKTKHEGIYDAMVSGDTARLDALKATYKTDGSYESAVRKALRLHDPRIKEMANARYEGDYDRLEALSYEIEAEGIFDMATIRAAYEAERTAQAKERGITLEEDSAAEQAEESTVFSMEEYYAAIRSGSKNSIQTAHNALIEEKKQEYYLGREAEDSIASSVTSKVKGEYLDEDISRADAKSILTKYGGKSKAEAETEIKKWEFQMEYHYAWGSRDRCYRSGTITRNQLVSAVMDIEDASREEAQEYVDFLELEMQNEKVDITASEASSYFEHAKSHGISVEVYLDYKARTKGIQNDKDANGNFIRYSAVKKIMTVIDSLPLTGSQKLALAESNGWADSTIQEYKTW